MASLTVLMEKMAAHLPGGTGANQSTATCGYYKKNHTLYITHQANRDYESILVAEGAQATKNVFDGRKKLDLAYKHPRITAWLEEFRASLPAQGDWRPAFDLFLDELEFIKVVMNQDLFVTTGVSTSGFHGESRIIRHLFLKYLRKTDKEDILSPQFSKESIAELEKLFKTFFAGQLYFGSSQGACTYCGDYMDELGIEWTTAQSMDKGRDDTWAHPITMTTAASGFGPSVSKYLYAPATADGRKQIKASMQ